MPSPLHPLEADIFERVKMLVRDHEQILDVGPARADIMPDDWPGGPGVLVVTDQRLLFGSVTGTALPMGWRQIQCIERRKKLAGAYLTVSMQRGSVSRFYLGKVYSKQIADYWNALPSR